MGVDEKIASNLVVEWFKDEQPINTTVDHIVRHDNHSVTIKGAEEDDLGEYKCRAYTVLDGERVFSVRLYREGQYLEDWIWLLIMECVLIVVLLAICIVCVVCLVRKRAKHNGSYQVKDTEEGKRKLNGTDIHYSVEDDEETDSMNKPLKQYMDGTINSTTETAPTPIIKNGGGGSQPPQVANGKKPVSLNQTGSTGRISGSENSLLTMTDEDEYLKRGMDEDGSFREGHYALT